MKTSIKKMFVAVSLPVIPGKTSAKINRTQDCGAHGD